MSPLTVLVSGMVAGVPGQGGATWAVLQYLLGLRRLGHHVVLIEPVTLPPDAPMASSSLVRYCDAVMGAAGLDGCWSLLDHRSRRTAGLPYGELLRVARRADVLLNISGMLADDDLMEAVPVRAYLDLDPAFNQLWHQVDGIDMGFEAHTHFATVGLCVGAEACGVPTCGKPWIVTPPPVVLDQWPVAEVLHDGAFTTVANFRSYGSIESGGVFYGQKAHSLRALVDLPRRVPERFRVALGIHPDETRDLQALRGNGWELADPAVVAGTPRDYRAFIQASKAELCVAKAGYVVSRSGWFSDRSACYLASGRPVIAQETGFSAHLPTGDGLMSFSTVDDVADAVDILNARYEQHRRAARALAEEYLDSDRVLGRLLEQLGAA